MHDIVIEQWIFGNETLSAHPLVLINIDLRCNIFSFDQNIYWKSIESIQLIKHTADDENDFWVIESEAFAVLVNWIKLDNCH